MTSTNAPMTLSTDSELFEVFAVIDALPADIRAGIRHIADRLRHDVTLRVEDQRGNSAVRIVTAALTPATATALIAEMRAELSRRSRRTATHLAAERDLDRE